MRIFGIIAAAGILTVLLVTSYAQGLWWFAFTLILLGLLVYLDYRVLAKPFRDVNERAAHDPAYLASAASRELCAKLIAHTVYSGPFTLREINALKARLAAYDGR